MTEAKALRAELAGLVARRRRGELDERRFEREHAEKVLSLYRTVIRARLAPGERIEHEHHVVHAHLKLSQSVLREPEQFAVSLFLTQDRLLRLRSVVVPGRAVTADDDDGTVLDELPLASISGIRVERKMRWGEAAAGALVCAIALAGRSWLAITGPLLLLLGAAGVVHALLMPTRWAVLQAHAVAPGGEIRIYALARKSGRALKRALRARLLAAVGE